MSEWKKTTCVLCGNLCGLEVLVENNRMVKVRPDKDNPRSQGYVCRKGLNIIHHQHHADRLTHPLKKTDQGFERISWDQALDEIAERLQAIVQEHGPRSLALMGSGTLGCPSQAAFAASLLRGLGSQYIYNALAQELTGRYWADGKAFGRQFLHTTPDHHETDMLLVVGKNAMMSHHLQQARRVMTRFAKDPNKILVVVDPRRSETARLAHIHLAIRPGTDALFYRALIAIILQNGWQNQDYIDRHVSGFETIREAFLNFDAKAALAVCELDYDQVKEVAQLFATRKSSHETDLGVLMTRHSTLISYLENVLRAICGRIGVPGGNVFPSSLLGRGPHSDETNPKTWRTVVTNFPAITALFPPNVMPEEILTDHPDRLRAVIVTAANPLRSFADTSAYEQAFAELDLLVSVDIAMTETSALAHYVLPARSGYESWDGPMGAGYPEVFIQWKQPLIEPEGEPLEAGEIFVRLADRLGLIPDIPQDLSQAAASGDRLKFGAALMGFLQTHPEAGRRMPFILAKTMGKALGSVHLASLWGVLQNLPPRTHENAARAGFTPGPKLGDDIFQAVLDHPEGLFAGVVDPADNLAALATDDGRIHLDVPEMTTWLNEIEPEREKAALTENEERYPFILSAGRHLDVNANTQMRDPVWNEGRRACTVIMHPGDAEEFGYTDGQQVKVTTEAGEEIVELEVTEDTRPGYLMIPHGFGLVFQGKKYGPNVNRLTKNTHRDRLAGTPLHRYIRCRVEAI